MGGLLLAGVITSKQSFFCIGFPGNGFRGGFSCGVRTGQVGSGFFGGRSWLSWFSCFAGMKGVDLAGGGGLDGFSCMKDLVVWLEGGCRGRTMLTGCELLVDTLLFP